MADMDQVQDRIKALFKGMTLGQKMSIGTTVVVAVVGVTLLFRWATQPDFALLYSNLDLKEADQIVQALQAQNVPYRISGGGSTVMVPSGVVYEWRMRLASQGLPSAGSIGYEVFDQKEIGISDFVQKINFRRAIEGELSRTIQFLQGIEQARVHIVIPEDRLFKKDQHETTASIVIKVQNGRTLREDQIEGIANLVAASVEGLRPDNVKIVDTRGRILSSAYQADSMMGVTSSQLDLQRRVESHLTEKAQSMLATVLGEGKAIVRVSAELNFQRIERTSENYDPNNTAVLSEERNEQSSSGQNQPTGQGEHVTTNYNVPKTVEHIIESVGDINRLSVSVVVDNAREIRVDDQGVETQVPRPRTDDEMTSLGNIVQNAVGYDPVRGDQFNIQNISFDTQEVLPAAPEPRTLGIPAEWLNLAQKAVPVLALIVFLLIIRSRLRSMRISMPAAAGRQVRPAGALAGPRVEAPLPRIDEAAPPEAVESAKLLQQISEFVEEKPSLAVKLLRYWLLEE